LTPEALALSAITVYKGFRGSKPLANPSAFDNHFRVFVIYTLAIVGATSHMLGEFFREAAVLLVIFVPLELWKPSSGYFNASNMIHVAEGTVVLLIVGIALEFLSILAHRIKRDLEVSHVS
jgi:hypothetical protein